MRLENGTPFLWDYQIKGFFKSAASALNRMLKKEDQLKAHKKIVDTLIFVKPRRIPIQFSGPITILERPLRGQTAKGERIALARSETVPSGSKIVIEIICLDPKLEKAVKLWLDYGELSGLGQWRNSGCGRFTYKIIQN